MTEVLTLRSEEVVGLEPQLLTETDRYTYIVTDARGNIHEVSVVPNPSTLAAEAQDVLVTQLTPVTGRGFLRAEISDALAQDVRDHVIGCERLVVCECEGGVSGFVAASLKQIGEQRIYHLEGIIVEPQFQATGIAYSLLRRELAVTEADILAFHTQSIKMVRLGNKLAALDRRIAVQVAEVIRTSNQVGARDVRRYGGQPLYADPIFAQHAVKSLNWKNGDALICAGTVRRTTSET